MRLAKLSVAMVEPRFGLNIGYVARTMENFGAGSLFIVGRDSVPQSAFRFASHGEGVVRSVRFVSLRRLRKMFDLVVGTTAIVSEGGRNPVRKSVCPARLALLGVEPSRMVILLGRDTTGLRAEELELCDMVVHIPTGTDYPTLNISHALAIILYSLSASSSPEVPPVKREYTKRALEDFSEVLGLCGYPSRKKPMAVEIMRKALIQSRLRQEEVVAMIGVFRRASLALQRRF